MDDEPDLTPPRARATLELETRALVWPDGPRGLARLECLDEAALVAVNVQCASGGPVIHVRALDGSPPAPTQVLWTPSLPGAQEPVVTIEPGRHREHAVGTSPPLSLPGPGRYAIHVEYAWEGGSARSLPVEVEVQPGPVDALVCRGLLGGTASPSVCLLGERVASGSMRLRLFALAHDGPPELGRGTMLGEVPEGSCPALSIPPQSLPTRQYVAYVEGQTLRAITHAHGEVGRLEQALTAPGWRVLGPPVEDRFVDGVLPSCEVLLVRDDAAGWIVAVASLGVAGERVGPRQPGAAPRMAETVAGRDGDRITLAFSADDRPEGPHAHGYAIRWREGHGVSTVEALGARPGTALALDVVPQRDGRAVGAALLRAADPRGVEMHVLELGPGRAPARSAAWARTLAVEVVRGVVRLDPRGQPHAVLETRDGRLHLLGPAGEHRELGAELGLAGPPYALAIADDRIPVLLYAEPGVGLRARALGRVPRARGPA